MKVAALLIVLLTHEGHWLSKTDNTVTFQWNAPEAAMASDLVWELKLDDVTLATGKKTMALADGVATVTLTCPDIRSKAALLFEWRLLAKAGGKELAGGSQRITAYPADLTTGWATLAAGKRIVVVGPSDGLAGLLQRAKVPFQRVTDIAALQTASANVVIVDNDALTDSPFDQGPLVSLAKSGAAIMVFRQSRPSRVNGATLITRALPREFVWQADHSLLAGFDADCRASLEQSWRRKSPDGLLAARADPEQPPAELIVQWPTEAKGEPRSVTLNPGAPVAADALLITRIYGDAPKTGRIVLCQIPLGDWQLDPRSQIFVGRSLDYLLSSSHTVGAQQ